MERVVNFCSAALFAVLSFCFGSLDGLLTALLVLLAVDYISGVMKACISKKLSSVTGFRGICKKMLILAIVIVANIVDVNVIGQGEILRSAVIGFYIANESISILENAASMGIPLPKKLKDVLIQANEENKVSSSESITDNKEED